MPNTPITDDTVSKTQRKKHMHDLQRIGVRLVELSSDRLGQLSLPESLVDAIKLAKKINAHGALRRQMQFIGRLMREVDAGPIAEKLDEWQNQTGQAAAQHSLCERWRSRLLAEESAFTELVRDYPSADLQHLRGLVRATRLEQAHAKPPRNFRALYRALFDLIQGDNADENTPPQPEPGADSLQYD